MSCASLLFTVEDREGSLEEVLKIFKSLSISLCRIESRPSKSFKWKYDIVVDFRIPDGAMMKELEKRLQERGSSYQFMESSALHGDHDSGKRRN
jgi:chorismate mutase / prephenate dehydratase